MSGKTQERQSSRETDSLSKDLILYDNLQKTYGEGDQAVEAVKGFNAKIDRGEFVSIVGPSGCGKSTILHLTSGVFPPTNGRVVVDGNDVQSEDHEPYNVGLVFQSPVLLEWRTVLKNVLLPIEIMIENNVLEENESYYEDRAHELLDLVGLDGFEKAYPRELSGGMQQRASICRSLVYDPSILLMDEPFGALDALTRDKLNIELLRIWRETQKTIVFVTHNLEEAIFLSDRVFILGERPATVLDTIHVDLDRPRDDETRTTDRYHKLVDRTYRYFQEAG